MAPGRMARRTLLVVIFCGLVFEALYAQVGFDRLRAVAREHQNWLTYSGNYFSQRYSELTQVTPDNVGNLEQKWVYQTSVFGPWQTTPLVVDGVMYLTQRPNDIVALDARTGRVFWIYSHPTSPRQRSCCRSNNRGVAVLGDTLFMATLDAHVVAVDATTGGELWDVVVADMERAYAFTLAPLAVRDKVIIGTGGGDRGIRGFIVALDAETGEEAWRFYTIPGPGEPGHETWEACPPDSSDYCDPEAWKHGGGAVWLTGSYDPELNLTYWGVGNPGPETARNVPVTTSTHLRWSPSMQTPASCVGISSSRRATPMTTTRCRFLSSPISNETAPSSRSCSGPIVTASTTSSTERPAGSCRGDRS